MPLVKDIFSIVKAHVVLSLSVVALSALIVSCSGKGDDMGNVVHSKGGETRETLSPALFTGSAAKAYRAAKEIPDVLDNLFCYCQCKKNFGHKSLLTCHVDKHSTYCNICMGEAHMASDMHGEGKSISEIQDAIDSKYERL